MLSQFIVLNNKKYIPKRLPLYQGKPYGLFFCGIQMLLTLFTKFLFLLAPTRGLSLVETNNQANCNKPQINNPKQLKCLHIYILMKYSKCNCPLISNVLREGCLPKQNWQTNQVLQIHCPFAYLIGADSLSRHS